jgi:membrane protein implicated in regulation of membrane protease activity
MNTQTHNKTTIMTRTIQRTNRSGSFSTRAEYTPQPDGRVRIDDWTWDAYGILPNGTEVRYLPLTEAQAEYRERKQNGWTAE